MIVAALDLLCGCPIGVEIGRCDEIRTWWARRDICIHEHLPGAIGAQYRSLAKYYFYYLGHVLQLVGKYLTNSSLGFAGNSSKNGCSK
jgi:hypothetical protein